MKKVFKKIKRFKLKDISYQHVVAGVVVLAVVVVGVRFIIGSFAASPYASTQAASGNLTSPATSQTCSGGADGNCVSFGCPTNSFTYGFDFGNQGPDAYSQDVAAQSNDTTFVSNALNVLSTKFSCSIMDQNAWGAGGQDNLQKYPVPAGTTLDSGNTNLDSIASRIKLIQSVGGTPMITLVQAPPWMYQPANCKGGLEGSVGGNLDVNINTPGINAFQLPPCPQNYQAFADLCAYIAKSFPQVKYFVFWEEMRDFGNYTKTTSTIDAPNFTKLYNLTYKAIKDVRSDAEVGGPYANMTSTTTKPINYTSSTLHGSWGYVSQNMQYGLEYWLQNKVGADFVAVDGATDIASANGGLGDSTVSDPLTASLKYAAVDTWLKSQTNLPIWWMESHIEPAINTPTSWTDAQAAAARIATLALMNSSGASVGMQWQPQDEPIPFEGEQIFPDEGLWTSTLNCSAQGLATGCTGGQPTTLANELAPIMPILNQRLTLVSTTQPTGVLAATEGTQLLLVNTNNATAIATVNGTKINLNPGQVETEATPK
jgi:hypothetical protein